MHLSLESQSSAVTICIPEANFMRFADQDFLKLINMINKSEQNNLGYRLYPDTKKESQWMMFAYCKLMDLGEPIPNWLEFHFRDSFNSIIGGTSSNVALGLVAPANRPKVNELGLRNNNIYIYVSDLMKTGSTLEVSAYNASEKFHLSQSSILKIYSDSKKMERELQELLKDAPF